MWWMLDPMWPTLFTGVVAGVLALIASVASRVGGAAILCLFASLSTATGIVIAFGTSDGRASAFYAVSVALVAIPAVAAISVLRRGESR
jgi:hypothetical protein